MEEYDEIDQETKQLLVDTLIQRTQKRTISWRNLKYDPILFFRGPRDEDESEPKILQTFKLTTDFNELDKYDGCSAESLKDAFGDSSIVKLQM